MAVQYPQRMSGGLRFAVMLTFGTLWLSGCYWLLLHHFFARPTDFGPVEHPWSPAILKIHGWIAVAAVFLLGWITARHVSDRWPQMTKRVSGVGIASVAAILAVTGYALYYTTDRLHDFAGVVHEVLGGAAILLALAHWRPHRRARRSRLLPG
ncbi:MAG: hypothetical protein ACJ8R9_08905 [Steroidobacteraceae bacterium]